MTRVPFASLRDDDRIAQLGLDESGAVAAARTTP